MQVSHLRYLILLGALTASCVLMGLSSGPRDVEAAQWPSADSVYQVEPWAVTDEAVEAPHGLLHYVSRHYSHPDGLTAWLLLRTSPEAKRVYPLEPWVLYTAGEDVPLWGHQYTFEPASAALGSPAMLVRGDGRQWLLLYRYGARGEQGGNGVAAWASVVVDGVRGQRNDYYLATLLVPLQAGDSRELGEAGKLADTVFEQLTAWYRSGKHLPAP